MLALFRLRQSFGFQAPDIGLCDGHTVVGEGEIVNEPDRTETGQMLVVSARKLSATGNLEQCQTDFLIRMKTKLYPVYSFGDDISFAGKLNTPRNFGEDNGRTFDYVGYLAKDDIYFEIKSATVDKVGIVSNSSGTNLALSLVTLIKHTPDKLQALLYDLRRHFSQNLSRSLGEPDAALAAGLVIGEKSAMGKSLVDDFRTVGLIHIVVLSGYSITIVGVSLRKIFSFLPRIWSIILGGSSIVLFCILVGGGATVIRSCLMAMIVLVAELARRDYNIIRSLFFAVLIMIIQSPMILLHDPSFQISVLATLGLILLAELMKNLLSFLPDKFEVRGIVSSTLATQIFVSPYIFYMMGQISLIGFIVNIIVLPFIPLTMLLIFLTGATGFISVFLSRIVGWSAHLLLTYIITIVEKFAKFPFAALNVPAFSIVWVGMFYLLMVSFLIWLKIRKPIAVNYEKID